MRNRILWTVGSGVMGVLLFLFLPSAMAQQGEQGAKGGNQTNQTDIEQQGEFEGQQGLQFEGQDLQGEHFDGAFSDGEHNDGAFLDGEHNNVDDGNVEQQDGEHEQPTSVGSNNEHDLNIEQILDLQEIKAAELTETR